MRNLIGYWINYHLLLIFFIISALHAEDDDVQHASEPSAILRIHLENLQEGAKPLEMVRIHAGTFNMGSPADERGRHDWEWLPHRVTITKDFYLGQCEVTQAQWEAVMGSNPAKGYGVGPNYPVYYVTWEDCQAFMQKINQTGQGEFRLPTEAEWEYACRSGTTIRFSHGDVPLCGDVCEPCEEHDAFMWWCGNNHPTGAKEVGMKRPNPWGLFDMHGNVYEWCNDWWQDPTERGDVIDPQGPATGTHKVLRGVGWSYDALGCRSAFRYGYSPTSRRSYGGFGFRLLRTSS